MLYRLSSIFKMKKYHRKTININDNHNFTSPNAMIFLNY